MAWRRVLIVLVVVGSVLVLLGYGLTRNPREIPTPLIGKPATSFALTLFDGRQLSLEELRGKVVFLNFWASWCPPCRAEARTLEAAWQKYKDQDVVFLGIDIQDTEEAARAFLREFGITYPNGLDAAGKIAIDFGVWGVPETFIIDREGRITYKHVGALGWQTITIKLDEALRGIVSTEEGKGEYRQVR
ncbi:MAG: TlpA family protein disulfide reductase [Candidatus Tectomicrobia bacterium]|nr:TlpA family protein disulfide reductase [Candidatus Tectomicrobia bacterium]